MAQTTELTCSGSGVLGSSPVQSEISFKILDQTLVLGDVQGDGGALTGYDNHLWTEPGFLIQRIHEDDLDLVTDLVRSAVPGVIGQIVQCRMRRADRRVIWVRMTVHQCVKSNEKTEIRIFMGQVVSDPTNAEEISALLTLKDDVLDLIINNLNHSTRAISGYAGMLERHLSIQEDTIGSEYALGMRNGLEELHTLLHHLRSLNAKRRMNLAKTRDLVTKLKAAVLLGG